MTALHRTLRSSLALMSAQVSLESLLVRGTLVMLLGCYAIAANAEPANSAADGDRHPAVDLVYPEEAFMHAGKGGRLIDVTKPPFNAKGDGIADDTGPLVAARDFVIRSHEPALCGRHLLKGSYILYFPNGTYLVSDSVNHNLPVLIGGAEYKQYWVMKDEDAKAHFDSVGAEENDSIILLGQSREKTVIRLKDHCPGFGEGAAKPVLGFFHLKCGSNVSQNNVVENMTIDTGSGNPGAVGIRWDAANVGAIRNVTIRSGDGTGAIGLMCDVRSVEGLIEDITIQGFDLGFFLNSGSGTIATLEHASFIDQAKTAIRLTDCARLSARKVATTNAPTALRVESCAHGVILDSSFQAKTPTAAVELAGGHLLLRNIKTTGYQTALTRDGKSITSEPDVDEYLSEPAITTESGHAAQSMRLPIEDSPKILHESDLANWANVDDYGAIGDGVTDDTQAIQKAMDSGKPAILFPKVVYVVNGTVKIPKTVRQVSFLYGNTIRTEYRDEAMFCVAEAAAEPLLMQQSAYNLGGVFLDHAAARTVVLEDAMSFFPHVGRDTGVLGLFYNPIRPVLENDAKNCWRLYRNSTPQGEPKKLFVNNALGFAPGGEDNRFAVENVTVWCRQVDTEHYDNNFAFRNSTVWILGFKTEGVGYTYFSALDGTRLEVLGGLYFQMGDAKPVIVSKDSEISVTMTTDGGPSNAVILENTKQGKTSLLQVDAFPPMTPANQKMPIIPLLVNFGK